MKNPTAIASFESEDSAGRVARKLRYAGFDARVRGEPHSGNVPQENGVGSGIYQVIVPSIQTVRALSWCREFDAAESLLSHAFRCPQCGSTRVTGHIRSEAGSGGNGKAVRVFGCHACYSSWMGNPITSFTDHPIVAH